MPDEPEITEIELPLPTIQGPGETDQSFSKAPEVVSDPGTAALAPQSAAEFAGTGRGAKSFGLVPSFEERNVDPGTPLDVEGGLSGWDRLQLARRSAERDQFAYLKNKYGDSIRKSDAGEWIVRVPDEATGKERDVVANPHKMTLGDFGALVGHAPEIAAWVAGEKGLRAVPMLGKMRGLGGLVRDVAGGAAAAETVGGLQDIETRALEDRQPIDIGEIVGRRAGGAVADVTIGVPLAGGARFVNWVRNPFGKLATDVQFDAIAAQKAIQAERGIVIPLNLAEVSGNPDIVRRTRMLGRIPGGAEAVAGYQIRQQKALQKLQDILIGTDYADELRVGKQAMQAAETKLAPLIKEQSESKIAATGEQAAKQTATHAAAMKTGAAEIESLIAGETLPERISKAAYVGDMIRNRVTQLRDDAKASVDALYENFRKLGGSSAVFQANDLAAAASKIMKDLPPQFKQTAAGPTVAGPSTAFVPEASVLRRLNELVSAKGASYRFSDLQQMRNEVFDDMAKSEAVPGLGKHYLSKIAGALTDAMEKGVNQLNNPALKKALQDANAAYKTQLVPFEKKGISELFANEFEKGHIFPGQMVESFISGPAASDRYNLLKQFIGADSLEMKALNRHIADSVLSQGQLLGAETINAKTFLRNLSRFVNDQPAIAEQVFGKKQAQLAETARIMIRADETAKLPLADVEKLVAAGKADTAGLQRLMRAQKALDEKTSNSILDAIKRKTVTGLDVSAEDVMNRWLPKASRDEISQFMSMLSNRPALVDDMRSIYAQKAFAKASETGKTVSEAIKLMYGDDKGRLLLGDKLLKDLQQYGALQKAIGVGKGTEMGASLASFSRLDQMLVRPLKFVPQAIREWATAKILTSDGLRKWALAAKSDEPGTIALILSSPPFIKAVADTYGTGSVGQNVMQTLHQGVGDWVKSNVAQQKADQEKGLRYERGKPKSVDLPVLFGPQGGAGIVGPTNSPATPP